jgi:N-acetyl-gamma-glutamyl-phosphate reductase
LKYGTEIETLERTDAEKAAHRTARVAIVGATGYAGRELVALLARHPAARLVRLMSSGRDGKREFAVEDSHPSLRGVTSIPVQSLDLDDLALSGADLVFLATPHEGSEEIAPVLLDRDLRVVDLSGAFRLKDAASYPKWYGFEHHHPAALSEAVYGIPEFNANAIRAARLVANPGCYATSVILGLAPLLQAGLVDSASGIICDAKSGASGAGRSLRDELLFSSVNENCRAYGLFKHRHIPEILQALKIEERAFTFTPHLLPVTRGILTTMYLRVSRSARPEDVEMVFQEVYAGAPLIRVYPQGKLPDLQSVAHTPYADIGWSFDAATSRLILVSALDNLGKGAASQAVQNMNLMLDWAEDTGLQ